MENQTNIGGMPELRPDSDKDKLNKILIRIIIVLVAVLIAGGMYLYISLKTNKSETLSLETETSEVNDEINVENKQEKIIQKSDQIVSLLKEGTLSSLKEFIHPTKGVRISRDGYIDEQRNVILKASEIDTLIKSDAKLLWGYTDGKGDAINLSVEDFFSKYLSIDFTSSQKKYNQVVRGGANSTLDIQGVYGNSNFVNYFIPYNSTYMDNGVEKPQTMDWRAINLVFEEYNGEVYLIGIIADNWTI